MSQMLINDKIKQVLTIKNLSPSYLADDIGVQRSSISHILSGRNRPSLDIIQKIVRRFPEFTYEWFLDTDVQLSTDADISSDSVPRPLPKTNKPSTNIGSTTSASALPATEMAALSETIIPKKPVGEKVPIDRILIFYTDGTFREYTPAP